MHPPNHPLSYVSINWIIMNNIDIIAYIKIALPQNMPMAHHILPSMPYSQISLDWKSIVYDLWITKPFKWDVECLPTRSSCSGSRCQFSKQTFFFLLRLLTSYDGGANLTINAHKGHLCHFSYMEISRDQSLKVCLGRYDTYSSRGKKKERSEKSLTARENGRKQAGANLS